MYLKKDNSPANKENSERLFLQENNVDLPWPTVSPEMNYIENVWTILGRKVPNLKPQTNGSAKLFNALVDAFEAIYPQEIRNLILN